LLNPFRGRDVIGITDFSRKDLEWLFRVTDRIVEDIGEYTDILKNRILGYAFFESSTRTRLSFEAAMKRLGGQTVGFAQPMVTSLRKGEKMIDTLRMLDLYCDVIVIRHPLEGAARLAAEVCECPIINGGDGKFQHPTQTMLDLYTIYREFGGVDGLIVGVLGDLKYARATNSFLMGLCMFRPKKIYLISPPILRPREMVIDLLKASGIDYEFVDDMQDVIPELDILYVVRIQKERFPDPSEYERIKGSYYVSLDYLERAKDTMRIMHPLPKLEEIDPSIDKTDYALYYKQAKWGLYIRMALLVSILTDMFE